MSKSKTWFPSASAIKHDKMSSYMQIWKMIAKMVEGINVFWNQDKMKGMCFIYILPIVEVNFWPYHAYSFQFCQNASVLYNLIIHCISVLFNLCFALLLLLCFFYICILIFPCLFACLFRFRPHFVVLFRSFTWLFFKPFNQITVKAFLLYGV